MKQVRNLKNTLTKRVRPALLAVILLFTMGFSGYVPKAASIDGSVTQTKPTSNSGSLTVKKTASKVENSNDQYKVSFDISGVPGKATKKQADIVLIVDTSGSMSDKISNVKTAAKNFCNDIFDRADADVRIGLVTFSASKSTDVYGKDSDGIKAYDFTDKNGKNGLTTKIGNISTGKGTNTESGIARAKDMLQNSQNSRPDADRYVVLFTDGLPTVATSSSLKGEFLYESYINNYGYEKYREQEAFYDDYFKAAQNKYNEIVGGIKTLGGIGYYDTGKKYFRTKVIARPAQAEVLRDVPIGTITNTTFYSCGLFTKSTDTEDEMAVSFLSTLQNVMDPSDYENDTSFKNAFKSKYYTNQLDKINSIFTDISSQIVTSINNKIASNVQISDTVSKYFQIPSKENVEIEIEINGVTKTGEAAKKLVSIDTKNNLVTFNLGDLDSKGAKISFIVTASDPYFSNNDIPTNSIEDGHKATISYKDPITKNDGSISLDKSPLVNIAPKQGSISIQKVVTGTDKADKFSVYLNRKNTGTGSLNDKSERYTMELVGNETKTMDFYLRGNATDVSKITNSTDMTRNYITAGKFTASEIVPMDYENQKMEYSYDNKTWNALNSATEFNIDKDHPNVYIRVTNNLVNNSYWRDRSDVSNTFKYTGK